MRHKPETGFTIIEVLIVLAISSLIMLIVFLAVPSVQRAQRDQRRRTDLRLVAAQLQEYANNRNGKLPYLANGCVDNAAVNSFINNFLGTKITGTYDIYFMGMNCDNDHSYIPDVDEIVITAGHWCNNVPGADSDDPPENPITGDHHQPKYFVAWTELEGNTTICIDNSTGKNDGT